MQRNYQLAPHCKPGREHSPRTMQTPCAAPQAEGLDKPAGEPVPVPAAAGAAAALAAGASSGAAAAEGGCRGSRAAAPPSPSAAAAGWTGLASCCLAQRSLLGPAWNHLGRGAGSAGRSWAVEGAPPGCTPTVPGGLREPAGTAAGGRWEALCISWPVHIPKIHSKRKC